MAPRSVDPLTDHPSLEVECFFDSSVVIDPHRYSWKVELRDGDKVVAKEDVALEVPAPQAHSGSQIIVLKKLGSIQLWELKDPKLYSVHVQLMDGDAPSDRDSRRIGFRE